MATPTIALGSLSAIKQAALARAAAAVFPAPCSITAFDAASGVAPQPVGREETLAGARNRARAALEAAGGACDIAIGVENGMWPCADAGADGAYEDAACVIALVRGGADGAIAELVEWSDALRIPPVAARPFVTGRDGRELRTGRNGEWSVLKDPHGAITGGARPREDFLCGALVPLLRAAQRPAVAR
jgi:non-canonical (house-cleaning) NTP pyrophosphatase